MFVFNTNDVLIYSGPHFSEYLYFTVTEDCTVLLACKVTNPVYLRVRAAGQRDPVCCLTARCARLLVRWPTWRRRPPSTGTKRMMRLFQKLLPTSCRDPAPFPSSWYLLQHRHQNHQPRLLTDIDNKIIIFKTFLGLERFKIIHSV